MGKRFLTEGKLRYESEENGRCCSSAASLASASWRTVRHPELKSGYRPHRYGKAPHGLNLSDWGRPFLTTCACQSTRRGGSGRRLLGRRSRRARGGGRSRARFTAAVHHAHFSRTALADRGTQPAVRYAETIDQLTSQATSLANWNDRIVRLLKWDVRHTLC